MPTLPNFYVFMPTAGDKIEKISANRATVRTEEVGNCKTVSSSGMARRMAVPSRPMYRSNGRVRRRYPFSKKGRKLAQGVLCEPSPSVKSKSKSSDSVQIEVRNYADQQNQTDASENSTTETPAYKKEIDADVSFFPEEDIDDNTTKDNSVIQNKRYKSETSKKEFFLLEKVV